MSSRLGTLETRQIRAPSFSTLGRTQEKQGNKILRHHLLVSSQSTETYLQREGLGMSKHSPVESLKVLMPPGNGRTDYLTKHTKSLSE